MCIRDRYMGRNTKVVDVVNELRQFGCKVDIYDPWANKADVKHEYGEELIEKYNLENYTTIVLAVSHREFLKIDFSKRKKESVLYDIKALLPIEMVDGRLQRLSPKNRYTHENQNNNLNNKSISR
eukprot:TRINITY_DN33011_c0_g1_i1.p2 TRINITY_DN33011_c0_g1~~TRINITY_DN33011_c0_g1_i1.p2  ORF type:complete len:125 (+),score=7.86 TRINITY_DN33011_c0_g1_i1:82-456(+)